MLAFFAHTDRRETFLPIALNNTALAVPVNNYFRAGIGKIPLHSRCGTLRAPCANLPCRNGMIGARMAFFEEECFDPLRRLEAIQRRFVSSITLRCKMLEGYYCV